MGRAAMIVGVGFDGGGLARAAYNTGRYFLRFLIGRSCCSHVQSPFMSNFGQNILAEAQDREEPQRALSQSATSGKRGLILLSPRTRCLR